MIELIVIFICLGLNSLLAAYEMAFVSFSRPEMTKVGKQGNKNAEFLLHRREHPERTLSVIQIGITLVGGLAAAVGGAGASDSIEPHLLDAGVNAFFSEAIAVLIVIVPLTYFTVVIGELVPKTLALRHPLKIAVFGARWLAIADRFLSPVISGLEWSTKILLRLFFPATKKMDVLPDATVELDTLSPLHQQYVLNLARIESKMVEEMMIPWGDALSVRNSDPMDKITSTIFECGHTRLPVIEDSGIKGLLHTKEFLAFRESGQTDWTTIVRSVSRVRGKDSALGALRLMQLSRSRMVTVYCEDGKLQGILTLEDIIEEVIGDISDEDDDGRIQKLIASRIRARQ